MKYLKEIRVSRGKNQYDIANMLGISYQAYAHYEAGRRQPDPGTLKKLADYFGVTIDYLLGRSDAPGLTKPPELDNTRHAFSGGLEGLTQEEVDDVARYIEFIKSKKNK